jgi:hypothetical protein
MTAPKLEPKKVPSKSGPPKVTAAKRQQLAGDILCAIIASRGQYPLEGLPLIVKQMAHVAVELTDKLLEELEKGP